ncbi:MAG: type IX secretion system membrane protein PorP/SprF [Cyclobacteriaceae bacterium]
MKKLIFVILLGIAFSGQTQMRGLTSTYPFNGLLINPAYAGSLNLLSITAVHREQWVNVEGAPTHQALTAHSSFASNRIGLGLMVTRDIIGVSEATSVYTSYAYKIRTGSGILALGIQGGFDNRRADYTKLELFDPDPLLSGVQTRFTPNFGTGIYFSNPDLFIGVSSPFLLENRTIISTGENINTDGRESRYYFGTAGVIIHLTDLVKLSPSVLARMQEQNRMTFEFTGMVIFDEIAYAGLSFRSSKDIVFTGQLILNDNIRVGYAYDAATSAIGYATAGSHEILLNYRIKLRNYKKDPQCAVYF